MNYFVALPLPAGDWHARVPPPPPGFRAFDASDLHVTVAFLGACGEVEARAAFAATRLAHSFVVTLGAVVPMGNPRRYSALSLLFDEGREALDRAIGTARGAAFTAANARPDDRPAKAHATLARPKRNATAADRERGLAWASTVHVEGERVELRDVALYGWAEDRTAKLFQLLDRAPLQIL